MSECEHDWAFDQAIVPSYPPIQRKICVNCLLIEHFRGMEFGLQEKFNEAFARYNEQKAKG